MRKVTVWILTMVLILTMGMNAVFAEGSDPAAEAEFAGRVPRLLGAKILGFQGVSIRWEEVPDAEGYGVYRREVGRDESWKRISVCKAEDTEYTDTKAVSGKLYYYTVRGYRKDGRNTVETGCDEKGLRVAVTVPGSVTLTDLTLDGRNAILSWEAVEGAQKYEVLRKADGGDWERMGYTKSAGYTDKKIPRDVNFTYTVKAIKKSFASGIDPQGLSVKIEIPKNVKLSSLTPEGLRRIVLTWEEVPGAVQYHVYRRAGREAWEQIDTVKETGYTERVPLYDTEYSYTVSADLGDVVTGYDETGLAITREIPAAANGIDPNKPVVAITYDDGPGIYTDQILDVLEKYHAKATFFMIGRSVGMYPDTVKRVQEMGCEIGNHSYTHPDLTTLSGGAVKSQITKTDAAITEITGQAPAVMRPPYGSYKSSSVRRNVGKPIITWSVDTLDWSTRSAAKTLEAVKLGAEDGAIILMHDIHKSTAEAAESVVKYLTEQGYQLVTVSELAYYKDIDLREGVGYRSFQ